jgi:methionyl-tRNA formyltransferase
VGAGHDIALVMTQPDRRAGRGLQPVPSAVKRLALERGLALYQPASLRSTAAQQTLREACADALVVAAYGLILPKAVLDLPRFGAINIHASVLPRWRGAAPIQRALLAGDPHTGISIMQMDAGLDTGPVLASAEIPIGSQDDAGTLHDALAELGARMILEVLAELPSGRLKAEPQPQEGACYAPKIDKRETVIDWQRPAEELERMIRAFRPVPGASTHLEEETIKLWRAAVVPGHGAPGQLIHVSEQALVVACGRDALAVTELQRPGGRRLSADAFLRGRRLAPGLVLGAQRE